MTQGVVDNDDDVDDNDDDHEDDDDDDDDDDNEEEDSNWRCAWNKPPSDLWLTAKFSFQLASHVLVNQRENLKLDKEWLKVLFYAPIQLMVRKSPLSGKSAKCLTAYNAVSSFKTCWKILSLLITRPNSMFTIFFYYY